MDEFAAAVERVRIAVETAVCALRACCVEFSRALRRAVVALRRWVRRVRRDHPELLQEAPPFVEPGEEISVAHLRAAIGWDGASLRPVGFNSEGGFWHPP